jgi:hypothetical protein
MRKIVLFISLVLALFSAAFCELTTKEPSFTAFTGSFLKFGKKSGNSRPFTMKIEYGQWHFEASGAANADHNTDELEELQQDLVVVFAYYDVKGQGYQPGLFDLMIYLDDEPIKVSKVEISLIGKAAAGSSILEQAKTWNFEPGKVWKATKYSSPIIRAKATALDEEDIAREIAAAKKKEQEAERKKEAAEKKRIADSIAKEKAAIAAEKKRVADSIAKEEAARAAAEAAEKKRIAAEKKRVADSIAKEEEAKKKAAAAEKKRIAAEKKRAEDSIAREEEAERKREAAERKKAQAAKRKAAEEEEEQPKPRKKKKKVEPEPEPEDDPPPKKKKKKRVVEEEEEPDPTPKRRKKST